MSKYKTPFPTGTQVSKVLENRTSKYKLPFKKDEPSEDLQLTLNNISQNNIIINSEIKLPKLTMSSDLSRQNPVRKHKNNLSIHEEINMSVKSDREEVDQNYIEDALELAQPKIQRFEMRQTLKQKQSEQQKPKASRYPKKKRRFLSSNSRYAEDAAIQNNTQQSDEQTAPNLKDIIEKPAQKELPIIGQSKIYRIPREDSDEDIKVWQTLSKDIEKYQEGKQKWKFFKNKMNLRKKLSKSIDKKNQGHENDIEYIESQLKKASKEKRQKRSLSMLDSSSLYGFKQKKDSKPRIETKLQEKEMKKNLNLFDKLKEIIEIRNVKPNKNKLKMPLDFYLSSYEQIKLINPFFRKLNQLEGCILLNIGKLTIFQAGRSIYAQGDVSREIFIIIYGKVLLSNKYKTLKKFALSGQTLGEQQLFQNDKTYIQRLKQNSKPSLHRYDAKTLSKSCLLRIKLQKYYKMYSQLSRMGYKQQFNLIDNLLRINFINKQTNLHQNERDRLQTEVSVHRDSHKHSPFFY